MRNFHAKAFLVALAAVGLLTACGGDSNDPATPSGPFVAGTEVPVDVEKNVSDVIGFSKQQIAATSDGTDPVLVGDAKLATDDMAEPTDI